MKTRLLRDIAYYKTGGESAFWIDPDQVNTLKKEIAALTTNNVDHLVIGRGTNSLILDTPFDGAAVLLRNFNRLDVDGDKIVVGAGVLNTDVANAAYANDLDGAGWMNFLPGEIGGTVRMNARCYGGEISQVVTKVKTVATNGEIKEYSCSPSDKKVFRGYKDTIFMTNDEIIFEVEFKLKKGQKENIKRLMDHCERDRKSKGQFDFPSCGCVFKNNYQIGVPSGMLLENAGAKELKVGKAEVSPHHANFVFNKGASADEILQLTHLMRESVFLEFGVWLEYEMEIIGSRTPEQTKLINESRWSEPNLKVEKLRTEFNKKNSSH